MAVSDSASRRQGILHALGISLVASLLLATLHVAGAFEMFDLRLLDLRFHLRGERRASDAIAIVAVDDATIRAFGSWPVPRDFYASLLDALHTSGARVIGIDLQFPEDLNQDPTSNALLAWVTERYENVVHAIWFHAERPDAGGPTLAPEAEGALIAHGVPAGDAAAPEAATVALPFPELLGAARSLGHVTVSVDRDGAIRRLPLWVRYRDRLYPSLALRMFAAYRGWSTAARVRWSEGAAIVDWPPGGRSRLPLGEGASTAIDFAGAQGAFPATYSMLQVLRWHRAGDSARLREAFADRIVLIGLASLHEAEDLGAMPFAATIPLIYVHANAIDNLLRDRFLARPPGWLYATLLVIAGGSLGWGFAVLPVPRGLLLLAVTLLATAALAQMLLAVFAIDAPPSAALALAPLIYAGIGTHRYLFLERRSRQREADIREGRAVQQRFLPEALVGQQLAHYRIEDKLGAGGMGVVYRGRDQRLERDVAVKVLTGASLADEAMRRRFRREALALSRLNHPHIATIYDFDSQDGTDFLVMEFVAGTALSDILARGPLDESRALRVGIQVADALKAAHAGGVLHRDLKPANIMLTPDGSAKVLDFGVAKMLGESPTRSASITESGNVIGTLAYLAPELLFGDPADARTDVYGLGMLLFEMLTGVRPFPDDQPHELMYMILNQPPPEPRVLNARVSPRLQTIVLRALEKSPDIRHATADELLAQLRDLVAAMESQHPAESGR